MGYVLKKDQLKAALAEAASLEDQPPFELLPSDLKLTEEIMALPTLAPLLATGDGGKLPPPNENGELVLESPGGGRYIVPPEYLPLVSFVAGHSGAFAQDASLQLLQNFFNWLRDLIGDLVSRKASLRKQIEDILNNADSIYEVFRKQVLTMQKDHDDNFVNFVLAIPDLFVYLCRLLSDCSIDRRAKAELVLALVYLVSPVDFLPELVIPPPYGFIDDIGVVIYFLRRSMRDGYVDRDAFERNWPGDPAFIDDIDNWWSAILAVIDEHVIESIAKSLRRKTKKS